MKRALGLCLLAAAMLALVVPASANRYHRNEDSHPLRLVAYLLHPVGLILEYGVARPVHYFVSQPDLDIVFGHKARLQDEGTYFEWTHADRNPTIGQEVEARRVAKQKMAK